MLSVIYVKERVKLLMGSKFVKDERGEFSVKGLALTIGAIVVIGFIVMWLASDSGPLQGWITSGWEDVIWPWIQSVFGMN